MIGGQPPNPRDIYPKKKQGQDPKLLLAENIPAGGSPTFSL